MINELWGDASGCSLACRLGYEDVIDRGWEWDGGSIRANVGGAPLLSPTKSTKGEP